MNKQLSPPTNPETEIEKHYSVDEVAELLSVHAATIRRQIYKRELRAVRIGTRLLIPASEVRRFLAGHAA